jgi:hypothetical protein
MSDAPFIPLHIGVSPMVYTRQVTGIHDEYIGNGAELLPSTSGTRSPNSREREVRQRLRPHFPEPATICVVAAFGLSGYKPSKAATVSERRITPEDSPEPGRLHRRPL